MSLTTAASGFAVFLLSVQVIGSQNEGGVTYTSRSDICAIKGSTVKINCTYRHPYKLNGRFTRVKEKFWFTKVNGNEPVNLRTFSQYSGRAWDSCKDKKCTLTITQLRESDSAEYKFSFITNQPDGKYIGSPGVNLLVTDPDLRVEWRSYSYWRELECLSSCILPYRRSYVWYKNGEKIQAETSYYYYSGRFGYEDSYSCAINGHEDFPSPSVCAYGQSCNRVTYTNRSICAVKGSSLDISCTYNSYENYIESKFWFSPDLPGQWQSPSQSYSQHRVQVLETESGRSTLRISDLTESDSAEYRFKFKARSFEWRSILPGTTLTVTALQVQVTPITVHHSHTKAELKCHSGCGPAARVSYVWFKNGQEVQAETSSYIVDFYPVDNISCALKGHEDYRSVSVYAPKLPSVSVSPSAEIMEGSSVNLTCSSDANPAANYTWYKINGHQYYTFLRKEPQLVFSSIQSSDSGEYYCAAENVLGSRKSEYISVNVKYAPKLLSVSVNPSGEIVEGSSVNLTCDSDANPAANYILYKENQTLIQGPEGFYLFTSISSEDTGIYHCRSENQYGRTNSTSIHIDVQYAPKLPSVSVSPSAEIVEGSSVNLTCSSDANPAANYTWYKENEDSPKASGQIFTITDFRAEHSGSYYCEAQNTRGRHNSTLHLTVGAGSMKSVAAGSIIAIFLAIIFLFAFLLIRGKRLSKQTTQRPDNSAQLNMSSVCDNPSAAVQRKPAEEQDNLCYATVKFIKNQEDPLYTNIRPAQPSGQKNEEEEEDDDENNGEYSVVNFNSASASSELRRQEVVEDSSTLYSTVAKKPRA